MRKVISIDIEATGLDVTRDRIVQLAMAIYDGFPVVRGVPDDGIDLFFNPGFPMSQEVIDIHGITDERVANCPPFSNHAGAILDEIRGAVLVGFNLWRFDLPILWEEFNRAGLLWNWKDNVIIDVGNIFKLREPRTLEAAVQFYLSRPHEDAHSAWADAVATAEVLAGQIQKYPDLQTMSETGLSDASRMEQNVDLAGKIVRNKDGEPVFAFGKSKGVRVVDDLGFANWILDRDFPTETKLTIEHIIRQWKRSQSAQASQASTHPEP